MKIIIHTYTCMEHLPYISELFTFFIYHIINYEYEACTYRKNRKCSVNTCWWNSGVKVEIQKKKEAYKEMEKNPTEETKNEYRRLKKVAKKAVAIATKEEAVRKKKR